MCAWRRLVRDLADLSDLHVRRSRTPRARRVPAAWLAVLAVAGCGPLLTARPLLGAAPTAPAAAPDLADVLASGELRHLGIRYANFVAGPDHGLDVEVVRLFAAELGVAYVLVETDWERIIPELLGREVIREGAGARTGAPVPRRGDLIATGMTRLPWRAQVVAFSRPMFPTQIWLVAPAASALRPITPSADLATDIAATCRHLDGLRVLAKPNTCLDPALYDLAGRGANVVAFDDALKFMAPAVLAGRAEATILDVPDALVALAHLPGRIKVLGPVSPPQEMAAAFDPAAVELRATFDRFLARIYADGTYGELVARYYPAVFAHFPGFFRTQEVALR